MSRRGLVARRLVRRSHRHQWGRSHEAVIDGQHTIDLIVEADRRETIEQFMAPFQMAGGVEVLQASSCAAVVARQGCA